MTPTILWGLAASLLLLLANAFFVASEFAIVKVRPTRMQALAKAGDRRAAVALRVIGKLDAYLSANQRGVTLASIGLGWLGGPAFAALLKSLLGSLVERPAVLHTLATVLAFTAVTFLRTVIGELAPESLAIQKAEGTTLWLTRPLHGFYVVFYPFIYVLNGGARLVLRLFGLRPVADPTEAHTPEEFKRVVAASHAHGRSTRASPTWSRMRWSSASARCGSP